MIELKNLQKITDQRTAVDISELVVRAGEVVALIGPVGSGVSELIELLTGRARPSAGTVRVSGLDPIADRDPYSRQVGVLFAEDGLYQQRSPLSNLQFHARLYGLPKSKAQEVLERVGLGDHGKAKMNKLASGLARRLAFGRAILHDPAVLLLVDPFARCDGSSINVLSGLIRSRADAGAAILILDDDDTLLEPICDVIHVLHEGRITATSRPGEEQEERFPFKIPVKLEGRVALLNPSDIYYADAEEGRAALHTTDGETLPTQFTLSDLEGRLARSGFFRAHRGYLVNLQHVTEVIPFTRNSFSLRLDDPDSTLIPLSKTSAAELKDLLDY
ncbi:MAG: ATP-binding cassette domain-containing protein [Anaerolineales bacterium]|nr:ATP-binding cassette domain-containing protein [Anaerolineales bacterium]